MLSDMLRMASIPVCAMSPLRKSTGAWTLKDSTTSPVVDYEE